MTTTPTPAPASAPAATPTVKEQGTSRYEALFLLEPSAAAKEWEKTNQECLKALTRHGAKVLHSFKWGERKLAYPVRNHKRGTYLIAFLDAPAAAIDKITREIQISETILRLLVTRYDGEPQTIAPALEPDLRPGDRGSFRGGDRGPRHDRR